ncbi:FAD-binding protein, partial [Streptobacillus moniliformis]|uniref:FAD-binding protein n=1 Tax=Streptobacillus moniliformis TaxID=34105 RepID=UPI000A7F4FDA
EEKNEDYSLVRVYSGVDFNDFNKFMKLNDLSGIQNMSGIPGSFGGITNMNAGAYGTEIFDVIEEVEVFDKKNGIKINKKKKMAFRYRRTEIKEN